MVHFCFQRLQKSKPNLGLLNSFSPSDRRLFLHASLHNAVNKILLCKRIDDQHGNQRKENLCRVRRHRRNAVAERIQIVNLIKIDLHYYCALDLNISAQLIVPYLEVRMSDNAVNTNFKRQ